MAGAASTGVGHGGSSSWRERYLHAVFFKAVLPDKLAHAEEK